uniref:Major facilitator superfamily (MFS) profile domain-containing protein n=2 Tax=Graphocephala atropunctata TaxID=36148 RepID=A0A1B6MEX5_9HEMI
MRVPSKNSPKMVALEQQIQVPTPDKEKEKEEEKPLSSLDGDRGNIALLLLLYLLQGIPLGLTSTVPLILQNKGVLYTDQAMFSLVGWPFSIKLLWAPILDAVFLKSFGRRKTWLVPVQFLIGVFMLVMSFQVDYWIDDPNGPHILSLTAVFFSLNFLAATQDIAVDGWALTMLKRKNVGHASTCNSMGQTAGFLLGYVVFMALESADFCNTYLRSVPQSVGIVTLGSFLLYCGPVFVVTTTLVGLLKKEIEPQHADESQTSLGVINTYRQLWHIAQLPAVRTMAIVLLTYNISFSATDAVSWLKLVSSGVPKEQFAVVTMCMLPLKIMLPVLLAKYVVGETPMDVFNKVYPCRLAFNLVAAGFVWATPHMMVKEHFPTYYYVMLVIIYGVYQVWLFTMFVTQMAFYARVSDPAVGGTYMTLLNTLTNLGFAWPKTLVLLFVDGLTFKYCSNNSENTCSNVDQVKECEDDYGLCHSYVDGYYILIGFCTMFGLLWMSWGRRTIQTLQAKDLSEWKVKTTNQK